MADEYGKHISKDELGKELFESTKDLLVCVDQIKIHRKVELINYSHISHILGIYGKYIAKLYEVEKINQLQEKYFTGIKTNQFREEIAQAEGALEKNISLLLQNVREKEVKPPEPLSFPIIDLENIRSIIYGDEDKF